MNGGQPSGADLLVLASAHNEALGRSRTAGKNRRAGMRVLLDCLQAAPGGTWQDRWRAAGLEEAADWKTAAGAEGVHTREGVALAAQLLFCHRVIRPGYAWLQRQGFAALAEEMGATTDAADFARVAQAAGERQLAPRTLGNVMLLLARVLVHTGKHLDELTSEDLFEYADVFHERGPGRGAGRASGLHATHMLLRHLGVVHEDPISVGSRQRSRRRSVPDMVDRHDLTSPKVRQLLIAYLTERAPGLDYASLRQIEIRLVGTFWADINRHYPELDTIVLPPGVAHAWKDRIRLLANGTPRRDLPKLFMVVRGFYLDIAEWAAEDPATWGKWVTPSPITNADMRQFAHHKHHQRARMHARIRTLAPALPVLVASVRRHLDEATELLIAAGAVAPGEVFVGADRRWRRRAPIGRRQGRGQPDVCIEPAVDPGDGCQPVNCTLDEEDAFWTWAIVEILRLTGLRIEELMELTHLSIRHYRTADGQLVVLLQVAPSKSDRERVLPVCPELAHALAVVVARVRGEDGKVPTICRYDRLEHELSPPLPFLLQRVRGDQQVPLTGEAIGVLLRRASRRAELCDVDGQSLAFTAHDFRRLFATEAVSAGLPIHIAAKLLGHLDLNTTQAYVAVYPDDVVRHCQDHLARRRTLRPAEEYRPPSEEEWAEFEQHFRRRKMALGDCFRPYGTDCPHEHACVRCPMLRIDPAQIGRLDQIEADTHRLLAEAREHGWEGEAAGLEATLVHIADKRAQAERTQRAALAAPVLIGASRP